MKKFLSLILMISLFLLFSVNISYAKTVNLKFYYPVGVSGPLAKVIDGMVAKFNKQNPDINVTPVFAGSYFDTMTKVQATIMGGNPPDVAILLSVDLFSLIDMDAIIPLDDYIKSSKDGEAYIKDFFPAFMENAVYDGKVWSIPFQRSTPILYYNKDAFREVGLDPNKPPTTWDELVEYGKKLIKKNAKGEVTRWAVAIPISGGHIWTFEPFPIQAGLDGLASDDGKSVYFDNPITKTALQFVLDLSKKYGIMQKGLISWGKLPAEFLAGRLAMFYHSTGSLTFIRKNAKIDFGVAFLPGKERYGVPTGGGNFYIFKNIPKDHQDAAWRFIQFMTTPENSADWSIASGYIGIRKSVYETPKMKEFISKHPRYLVAKNQLKYAHKEFSVHNRAKVAKCLFDAINEVLLGQKEVGPALSEAQKKADEILKEFK